LNYALMKSLMQDYWI